MTHFNIAVIGAGIAGTITALELVREIPKAKITIIADRFIEDTSSSISSGLFYPGLTFDNLPEKLKLPWLEKSYNYWNNIRKTAYASQAGVTQISGYHFFSKRPVENRYKYIENLVPIYREITREESELYPGKWKYGSFFTTLLVDPNLFLLRDINEFQENGGKIIKKKIENFSKLPGDYDVIVNCAGLGSRYLCHDELVQPLRVKTIKVEAPWIKMFSLLDDNTYIVPGWKDVTLGSIQEFGTSKMQIEPRDIQEIRQRCEKFMPSVKDSRHMSEMVRLKPYRSLIRTEKEIISVQNRKKQKIVHNYGHGYDEITLAPATAMMSVCLVKELMMGNSKY